MQQINFQKERDLGQTLEAASIFIKQHFFNILKPTLIVVIIPLVLGALLMASGMKEMFGSQQYINSTDAFFNYMINMLSSYGLIMIAYVLGYVVIIGYIKLYASGVENITLNDLLPIVKSKAIFLTISSIALVVVMYIGLILCVLPGIYLSVVLVHFYAVAIIEDAGFGESWKRCFYLIKDNWWSTFGLYIVTYLISFGIMILAYIPMYAIMGMQMFKASSENDPTAMFESMSNMAYFLPIYYLIGLVITILWAVISTFRYYSLVENKDGSGEKELINQL
ncbi:MAG: hypothetical protein RLO81_07470 [Fulvivirga sp.]|uniref:DUF7847 domain-containing protein n=1 Tax=Fulvivirga sp. TaxID=1931237 RepID=UPI0032EF16DF